MGRFLFLLIIVAAGLGVLLYLGTWQVQRLAWKEGVLAEIEARIAADPVAIPEDIDRERDRYLPVTVTGEMLPGEIHVLVSVKRVGPGYRILAPFDDGTRVIMIDRGFVPIDDKNKPRAIGPMTITGNLHWPDEVDDFTPEPDIEGEIWFAREVDMASVVLGTDPILLIAKSKTDPNVTPLPVDTSGIPNDHLQYAVTWFGLALVWAAMSAFFLWRTRARTES